jgi:2-polyprenyl-6-methoxyphenol hydroxylase-like FAD-dependent oxidoreductase
MGRQVTEQEHADVVVVGAGPTGLLLAGDLAEAGVRVLLLERRAGESNLARAFAVHARTMEQLQIRGVAAELAATGTAIHKLVLYGRAAIDFSRLPSRFPSLLITPQSRTEDVLTRRLRRLGVSITGGSEVTGVSQDSTGVDVRVRTADGAETCYRASYAVGADGVHSAVRAALGLPYPGRSVVRSLMLADVRLADPPADVLAVNGVGDAFAFVAPFGDGWYRIFAWNRRNQVGDSAPVELSEVRETTRRALGTDFGMHDPRFLSRFHSDERQVPTYRVGRVFLAGDAAHCHSPAGGQGMNTGIQDAANLGWKLAAAVGGWGTEDLLDSYDAERHPVGRHVLRSSGLLVRLALIRPRWARAARNAIAAVLLAIPPVSARIASSISAIGVRYPAPAGSDPRVGTRAADVELSDGRTLAEALRGGRFVLLGLPAAELPDEVDAAQPRAGGERDSLTLVRPDGYVGWAGAAADFPAWADGYFRRTTSSVGGGSRMTSGHPNGDDAASGAATRSSTGKA